MHIHRISWPASFALALLGAASCQSVTDSRADDKPRLLWTHADPAGARSLPYADGDLTVFTTGFAQRAVALDARTGQPRWERALPSGPGIGNLPNANIVASNDLVFVPAWELYALDRASGAVRWKAGDIDDYPAASSIALEGDLVITPGAGRHLFAFDAATGTRRWKTDLGGRPFAPVVAGGVVYVGTRAQIGGSSSLGAGKVFALRSDNGAILWDAPLPNSPDAPWLGGTNRAGALTLELFVVASTNGRIYGFDRQTGRVRWEHAGNAPFESGVTILSGVVVAANLNGDFVGLDANTGVLRWRASYGGSSVVQQVTNDGTCAYISVGALLCLDMAGSIRWVHGGASNGGPDYFTPARAADGRLYAGSSSGFHALSPAPR